MKRILAVVLAGALVAGFVGATPAIGKKKKKIVKTPLTLHMRQTAAACGTPHYALLIAPSTGEDVECWPADNFLQEVANPLIGYLAVDWPAEEGVPFVLDATTAATGKVTVRSFQGAGGGLAELQVILLGQSGGEEKTLGTYSTEYTAAPNSKYTFDYEIDVDDALNKLTFESFTLRTIAHGVAINHGVFELDDPASFVTVPTLVKKKKP
jgi:hypothetical protein